MRAAAAARQQGCRATNCRELAQTPAGVALADQAAAWAWPRFPELQPRRNLTCLRCWSCLELLWRDGGRGDLAPNPGDSAAGRPPGGQATGVLGGNPQPAPAIPPGRAGCLLLAPHWRARSLGPRPGRGAHILDPSSTLPASLAAHSSGSAALKTASIWFTLALRESPAAGAGSRPCACPGHPWWSLGSQRRHRSRSRRRPSQPQALSMPTHSFKRDGRPAHRAAGPIRRGTGGAPTSASG